jgi:hypothetical protein
VVFAGTSTGVVTHNSSSSSRVRRCVATRHHASGSVEYKIDCGAVILDAGLRRIDRAAIESGAKPALVALAS